MRVFETSAARGIVLQLCNCDGVWLAAARVTTGVREGVVHARQVQKVNTSCQQALPCVAKGFLRGRGTGLLRAELDDQAQAFHEREQLARIATAITLSQGKGLNQCNTGCGPHLA